MHVDGQSSPSPLVDRLMLWRVKAMLTQLNLGGQYLLAFASLQDVLLHGQVGSTPPRMCLYLA